MSNQSQLSIDDILSSVNGAEINSDVNSNEVAEPQSIDDILSGFQPTSTPSIDTEKDDAGFAQFSGAKDMPNAVSTAEDAPPSPGFREAKRALSTAQTELAKDKAIAAATAPQTPEVTEGFKMPKVDLTKTTTEQSADNLAGSSSIVKGQIGSLLAPKQQSIVEAAFRDFTSVLPYTAEDGSIRNYEGQKLDKATIRSFFHKDKDGAYQLPNGKTIYSDALFEQFVDNYYKRYNHPILMQDEDYRKDYIMRNYGKTEEKFIADATSAMNAQLDRIEEAYEQTRPKIESTKVYPYVTNDEPRAASKSLRDLRKKINSISKDNFWSGFNESFDVDDMLALGIPSLGTAINQLSALNKYVNGEELTPEENLYVQLNMLSQQIDQFRGEYRNDNGLSMNRVGNIVGFMPQFATQIGISSKIAPQIGAKVVKDITLKGVANAMKESASEGLKMGLKKVSASMADDIIATPLMTATHQTFADRRLGHYAWEGEELVKEKSPWAVDYLKALGETFVERHSEQMGEWITGGLRYGGKRLAQTKLLDNAFGRSVSRTLDYKLPPVLEQARKNLRVSGYIGEVASEIYANAINPAFTGETDSWKELLSGRYYWDLLTSIAISTGSFYSLAVPDYIRQGRSIKQLDNSRAKVFANISSQPLKDVLQTAFASDNLEVGINDLASIDWKNISTQDAKAATEYIFDTLNSKLLQSEVVEAERLQAFLPVIEGVTSSLYSGGSVLSPKMGTELQVAELKDGNTAFLVWGDINDAEATQFVVKGANGELSTINREDIGAVKPVDMSDYLAEQYSLMFSDSINKERLTNFLQDLNTAQQNNTSPEAINKLYDRSGYVLFGEGENVTFTDGSVGVVVGYHDGKYDIADPTNPEIVTTVGFLNILQPNTDVATAQVELTEEISNGSIEVDAAVEESFVSEEDILREKLESAAEQLSTADGTGICVIRLRDGREAVVKQGVVQMNEDNSVDTDNSSATIVIKDTESNTTEQIGIDEVESIIEELDAQEAIDAVQSNIEEQIAKRNLIAKIFEEVGAVDVILTSGTNGKITEILTDETYTFNWVGEDKQLHGIAITLDQVAEVLPPKEESAPTETDNPESAAEVAEEDTFEGFNPEPINFDKVDWDNISTTDYINLSVLAYGPAETLSRSRGYYLKSKENVEKAQKRVEAQDAAIAKLKAKYADLAGPGEAVKLDKKVREAEAEKVKKIAAVTKLEQEVAKYAKTLEQLGVNIQEEVAIINDRKNLEQQKAELVEADANLDKFAEQGTSEAVNTIVNNEANRNRIYNLYVSRGVAPDQAGVTSAVLWDIVTGNVHLRWEDYKADAGNVEKGLGSELGLANSTADKRAYKAVLDKNGMSVDSYVHSLWERMDGYSNELDDMDMKNEVLSVLQSTPNGTAALQTLYDALGIEDATEESYSMNKAEIAQQMADIDKRIAENAVAQTEFNKKVQRTIDRLEGKNVPAEEEETTKPSLMDVVKTLYTKGKEVASRLFAQTFFSVAQTPQYMKDLGLRGERFTIRYGVIARHFGKDAEHTFSRQIWEQLPVALQNPFAITKYYKDANKQQQKGYRLYTSLRLDNGSYIVVSAEVKNSGRDIEVNSINTLFGRNSISEVHDELIYVSKNITPEQQSLLNGNNPHQYPDARELSTDKDTTNIPENQENQQEISDSAAFMIGNAPRQITYKNYFDHTGGTFEAVERPDREPDYVSMKTMQPDKVSSEYWYGEDEGGKYVVRGSNHWSGYAKKETTIDSEYIAYINRKNVPARDPRIASCWWGIYNPNFGLPSSYLGQTLYGKVYLSDMHDLTYDENMARDVRIVAPEGTSAEKWAVWMDHLTDTIGADNVITDEEQMRQILNNLLQSGEIRTMIKTKGFYSDAERAVEEIKQEKATPQQWLAMLQKNGGLKAGEDKWIGLSDWLKASDKKTLTKQEVLDYIRANKIQIEEVQYGQSYIYGSAEFEALQKEYDTIRQRIIKDKHKAHEKLSNELIDKYGFADNTVDMDALNDDDYSELNELNINEWQAADMAWQELVDKYGDDFEIAFSQSGYDIYIDNNDAASSILGLSDNYKDINKTRLIYTTEGLSNKREIALTVPTIESWKENDEIHFGDADNGRAVAWIRFGETTAPREVEVVREAVLEVPFKAYNGHDIYRVKDTNGKHFIIYGKLKNGQMMYVPQINDKYIGETVETAAFETLEQAQEALAAYYKAHPIRKTINERILVIDEIQSNRHQEGRKRGYESKEDKAALDAIIAAREELGKEQRDFEYRTGQAWQRWQNGEISEQEYNGMWNTQFDAENKALRAKQEAIDAQLSEYKKNKKPGVIPAAPFEQNWAELAMKRMLRYAADNGFDKVAWTTGAQQAERYSLNNYFSSVSRWDINTDDMPGRYYTLNGSTKIGINVNEDGQIISASLDELVGKPLSDVVGKEVASKMMEMEDRSSLEDIEFQIGGEGMKAFYDKMLVSFMNKYGKKWDARVGEVTMPELDENNTMHAVDITNAMRISVLEGQPMFRAMMTSKGEVYGFTYNGKIYLDPTTMNVEAPIHEYTELWSAVIEKQNPELWAKGKELLKQTNMWKVVNSDPNYKNLPEDLRASETLSRIVAAEAAKKINEVSDSKNLIAKLRAWIRKFWNTLKATFSEWSAKDINNLTLREFKAMPLRDFIEGVNPLDYKVSDLSGFAPLLDAKELEEISAERKQIEEQAKANGTWLKAPNGQPTNLTPEQWVTVHTRRFKEWFGDWEKAARIEKLRKSKAVSISGKEFEVTDDFKQNKKNALKYSQSFTGEYTNADTGATIAIYRGRQNGGVNEVLQHNYKDIPHIQSIAAIPDIIKNSIYIESQPNNDVEKNPDVAEYQCYVCGLNIAGEDYTVLAKIAVDKKGNRYYDHNLTAVEKGKLIDIANNEQSAVASGFGTTPDTKSTTNSQRKYRELLSILQTNASKIVDANGEPMPVYHGSTADNITEFDKSRIRANETDASYNGFWFSTDEHTSPAWRNAKRIYTVFLNIKNPIVRKDANKVSRTIDYDVIEELQKEGKTVRSLPDATRFKLQQMGYDGVIDFAPAVINEQEFRDTGRTLFVMADGYAHILSQTNDDIVLYEYDPYAENKEGNVEGIYDSLEDFYNDSYYFGESVFVAFEPNQIKSATDNIGTFDSAEDDIRYSQLSSIDAEYMEAVRNGNIERAKELVRQYAETRGYTTSQDFRDGHGAPTATVEKKNFTNAELINQQSMDDSSDVNLFSLPQGENLAPNDFWSPQGPRWYMYNNDAGMQAYTAISSAIRAINYQLREYGEVRNIPSVKVYRAVPNSIEATVLQNGDWVTPSKLYADRHGKARFGFDEYKIIEQEVPATELWWDGNDAREWGYDNGNVEATANTPNNVKLLDPITYDDEGNIIPLSSRFDKSVADPRFMFVGEKGAADNSQTPPATAKEKSLQNKVEELRVQLKDNKKNLNSTLLRVYELLVSPEVTNAMETGIGKLQYRSVVKSVRTAIEQSYGKKDLAVVQKIVDKYLHQVQDVMSLLLSRRRLSELTQILNTSVEGYTPQGVRLGKRIDDKTREVFKVIREALAESYTPELVERHTEEGTKLVRKSVQYRLKKLTVDGVDISTDFRLKTKDGGIIADLRDKADDIIASYGDVPSSEDTMKASRYLYVANVLESYDEALSLNSAIGEVTDEINELDERIKELSAAHREAPAGTERKTELWDGVKALRLSKDAAIENRVKLRQQYAARLNTFIQTLEALIDKGVNDLKLEQGNRAEEELNFRRGIYRSIKNPSVQVLANREYDKHGQKKPRQSVKKFRRKNLNENLFLGTFAELSKELDITSIPGSWLEDGWYNQFMLSEDGYIYRSDWQYNEQKRIQEKIDDKVRSIFAKSTLWEKFKAQSTNPMNIIAYEAQAESGYTINRLATRVDDKGQVIGGFQENVPLTIANLLYIRNTVRQPGGKSGYVAWGISETTCDRISAYVEEKYPEYCQFADWVVNDLLPELYEMQDTIYFKRFNTHLTKTPFYFPIVRDKRFVGRLPEVGEGEVTIPSSVTGNIVERVKTSAKMDLSADMFSVLNNHIKETLDWCAYSELTRKFNMFSTSRNFRNILDAQDFSVDKLKETYEIAIGQSKMRNADDGLSQTLNSVSKTLVAGNIVFNFNAAIKQVISGTAILGYSADPKFMGLWLKNYFSPSFANYGVKKILQMIQKGTINPTEALDAKVFFDNWRWAIENIPTMRARWEGGKAGFEVFKAEGVARWDKVTNWITEVGLKPNAFVDMITCANGTRTVYEYQYARNIKQGMSKDEAHKDACVKAAVLINETQQSSLDGFLSSFQSGGGIARLLGTGLGAYQNTSMAFARNEFYSLESIFRMMRASNRTRMIDFKTEEYRNRGYAYDKANEMANNEFKWQFAAQVSSFLHNAIISNYVWLIATPLSAIVANLFASIGDEEERKKFWHNEAVRKQFAEIFTLETLAWQAPLLYNHPISKQLLTFAQKLRRGENFSGNIFESPVTAEIEDLLSAISKQWIGVVDAETGEVERKEPIKTEQTVEYIVWACLLKTGTALSQRIISNIADGIQGMIEDGVDTEDIMNILNSPRALTRAIAGEPREGESQKEYLDRMSYVYRMVNAGSGEYDSKWQKERTAEYIRKREQPLYEAMGIDPLEVKTLEAHKKSIVKGLMLQSAGKKVKVKANKVGAYNSLTPTAQKYQVSMYTLSTQIKALEQRLETMVEFDSERSELLQQKYNLEKELYNKWQQFIKL